MPKLTMSPPRLPASISTDLTLILMSNRQNRAIAALNYYSTFNCKIIFACTTPSIFTNLSKYFNHNPNIIILPTVHSKSSQAQRLRLSSDYLSSQYCAIVSDDDLLLPAGVISAIKYLNKHLDYSTYFGLCCNMAFTSFQLPIFSLKYNVKYNQTLSPSVINDYMRYRQFPLIYGISRSSVFKSFIDFLPQTDEPVWQGVWELSYALASASFGHSFYSTKSPFLLRLVHQTSRYAYVDYPKPPSLDSSLSEYVAQFLNLASLRVKFSSSDRLDSIDDLVHAIFADIYSDSSNYRDDPSPQLIGFSDAKLLFRWLLSLIRDYPTWPSILFNLPTLFYYSCLYFKYQNEQGVEVRASTSLI